MTDTLAIEKLREIYEVVKEAAESTIEAKKLVNTLFTVVEAQNNRITDLERKIEKLESVYVHIDKHQQGHQ